MRIERRDLDLYMFVDPAGRAKRGAGLKKRRPRQAVVVIGVDWLTRVFLLHAWAGNLQATQFVGKIIDVYTQFSPRSCGIEANAMQELFAELVHDEAVRRMGNVRMRPIYQNSHVDKDWRIRTTLEPIINQGRLFIMDQNAQLDAEVELQTFPTGKQKDIVDALASAVDMVPARNKARTDNDEIESVAQYLRETGAPPWYIEQRVNELKQEAGIARTARGETR